jgi:hypothetical membrane protein
MKPIGKPAFIAAIIGPIQSVLGWVIAGALWAEYNPVTQTISDLAAFESPVKWIMECLLSSLLSMLARWLCLDA